MMTQSSSVGDHGNWDGAGMEGDDGVHDRKIRDHLHSRHKERKRRRAEFATRRNQGQMEAIRKKSFANNWPESKAAQLKRKRKPKKASRS